MKIKNLIPILPLLAFAAVAHAGKLTLVAGGGDGGDGVPATQAKLREPFAAALDARGNLFLCEIVGRVLKVDGKGVLTVIGGLGAKGSVGDGGPLAKAWFNQPHNLILAPNGDLLITDTLNSRVRKVDARTGLITTIAGTGEKGFGGDGGPAAKAQFSGIFSIALERAGRQLFICDLGNRRIRAMDMKTGLVRTVAGNGQRGAPADGADAANSPLSDPRAVCVDSKGNVYILERGGHALRVVDRTGKIRTVAGTGKAGFGGDGGDALKAGMNGPKHLYPDLQDNILICDTENHVVRKYMPASRQMIRVAGTGTKGAALDADPLKTELARPHGVYVHTDGAIYIADSENGRVLKVAP
jgi:sugar lactone lactonase YvrE